MCVSSRYKKRVLAAVSQKKKKKKMLRLKTLSPVSLSVCLWEKSNVLGSRSCASFSSSFYDDDDDEFWVVWQFSQKESREQHRECE